MSTDDHPDLDEQLSNPFQFLDGTGIDFSVDEPVVEGVAAGEENPGDDRAEDTITVDDETAAIEIFQKFEPESETELEAEMVSEIESELDVEPEAEIDMPAVEEEDTEEAVITEEPDSDEPVETAEEVSVALSGDRSEPPVENLRVFTGEIRSNIDTILEIIEEQNERIALMEQEIDVLRTHLRFPPAGQRLPRTERG